MGEGPKKERGCVLAPREMSLLRLCLLSGRTWEVPGSVADMQLPGKAKVSVTGGSLGVKWELTARGQWQKQTVLAAGAWVSSHLPCCLWPFDILRFMSEG